MIPYLHFRGAAKHPMSLVLVERMNQEGSARVLVFTMARTAGS
ncbi:hypothetical protein [Nostoc sp.]